MFRVWGLGLRACDFMDSCIVGWGRWRLVRPNVLQIRLG